MTIEDAQKEILDIYQKMEDLNERESTLRSWIKNAELNKNLKEFEFRCEKCLAVHKESAYCVAQRASGYSITHKCGCGNKTYLEAYEK
jgi:hypothetical protein